MYNSNIGILKFILSLLVVAIHTQPFEGNISFYLNHCIARLAVPIFFIISSYYLFDKLLKEDWDKNIFIKQQLHLGKYYLGWVILHLPFIVNNLIQSTKSTPEFIWKMFQGILLKGPYGSLWFLPASLLALTLVYLIGKRTSPRFCLMLSLPFFLFTTIEIEYNALVKNINWINAINHFFTSIFGWLANGLNMGFLFCSIGFYIAANKEKKRHLIYDSFKAILCIGLLLVETTLIKTYQLSVDYWAMFFLIPSAYYVVQTVLGLKQSLNQRNIKLAKHLQTLSLLIYPMHFAIMDILKRHISSKTWLFVIVLTVTVGISEILLFLGKKKNLKIIKILYGK